MIAPMSADMRFSNLREMSPASKMDVTGFHVPPVRGVPVQLLLQHVQAGVQLVALLSTQAVKRRVEHRRGGRAAAGDLLVLPTSPILPPETEDVGDPGEGACGRKRRRKSVEPPGCREGGRTRGLITSPDRALQVFPVLASPSASVWSLSLAAVA